MGIFGLGKGGPDDGTGKEKPDNSDGIKDDKGEETIGDDGKEKPDAKRKDGGNTSEYSEETVKELIKNAITEATRGLIADNNTLKEQIKELSRKGLKPEQIAELEKKDREDAQNKREAEITERENRFYALTAIKEAGLDDGGKTALELINLVMGKDQNEIDSKVKTLNSLVKNMVKTEVDKTFKDNGRAPKSSDDSKDKDNTIAKKLGKRTAEANKKARSVLDMYIGGNK